MLRLHALFLGLCTTILAGQAAFAQAGGQPGQAPSGLTRVAFIGTMDAEFRRRDANGDGFIAQVELQQYERGVTLEAATAENARFFAQLDADRNGVLTPKEFATIVAVPPAPDVTSLLDRFDQNRDRKITIIEYRAATLSNFDRLDTDLDGTVTDAEMAAANLKPPPGSGR